MNTKKILPCIAILAAIFISTNIITNAQTSTLKPEAATIDAVWDALSVFEGSYKTVSPDFDCQGMSIGVAQWNIGKSFPSVKKIITANKPETIRDSMPVYGNKLMEALNGGKNVTLSFVRSLQSIKLPSSCDAKERQATWNTDGIVFAAELGKLLATNESKELQKKLRSDIFLDGWRNANKWAIAYRGEGAKPTMKELAYFVDMMIFSGGGLDKFGVKYEKISSNELAVLSKQAIDYLRTANDNFLLHKIAARKNADTLQLNTLNESEMALFVNSYLVSKRMNASHARQFKLTSINRKAAILFGQAYYSDRDTSPTVISLSQQEKN